MLEIKFIRKNLSVVQQSLSARHSNLDLEEFVQWDEKRRRILGELESLRHERNVITDQIAGMKRAGRSAEEQMQKSRAAGKRIKELEKSLDGVQHFFDKLKMELPNIPHATVPIGKNEDDNQVIKTVGKPPEFDFAPKAHDEIGSHLKILDLERAARITGARFPLYFGAGALLERALINFMLDTHTSQYGFTEVLPPFIVNRKSMTHTGQLPKFEMDLFKLENWDYFLIPTAEVPVTNIHHGETLSEEELPIYYTAYTPCFRSEAGSHGKDTRGLIRQHQFNKVELVKFTTPQSSYSELELLLAQAEAILKLLELPYQVIELCTGDLGFSSAKTYDLEVWMPSQGVYREISSCSNFEDFQARRGNIRYRPKGKKGAALVHTLNGSGLAVGRTVAALLENFQQADGSVLIPEKLRPYMGGKERISL